MDKQLTLQQPQQNQENSLPLSLSDQDFEAQPENQGGYVSDPKIDDLHNSLARLRLFVARLPIDKILSVPLCVEQYCQKIDKYKINMKEQIIEIAERRVNKMVRNHKVKKNWNIQDVMLLVWLISKRIQIQNYDDFSQMSIHDWEFISNMISGSSWQKCKFKWLGLKKVKLITNKWSKIESQMLGEIISSLPKINWNSIAQELYQRNKSNPKVFRTAKQCREHWNCFINPKIQKGPWNSEQDRKLIQYVLQLEGLKKWSQISKYMEGRTQNALKNRYNLLLKKQRKISGNLTQKRLVKLCLNRLMLEESQSQRSEIAPQIPSQLNVEPNEAVQKNSSKTQVSRLPIVPSISQSLRFMNNPMNFNFSYSSFTNYFGNDQNNYVFSNSLVQNNGYFIGFLYPRN